MDTSEIKIKEFQTAMDRYNHGVFYKRTGMIVSIYIVTLQIITTIQFLQSYNFTKPESLIIPLIFSYILTDFINGLVHMYMDNNTKYKSTLGPFIAAFHLHHLSPKYTDRHALKIYFYESGTKFWLVIYLTILASTQYASIFSVNINFCLVCIGIFSSLAEVSHFWCHNSNNKNFFIKFLQNKRILLSKKHHLVHHVSDNKNYAFLNGFSDPLINLISNYLYAGYKNHSDQHAKAYKGQKTDNRG